MELSTQTLKVKSDTGSAKSFVLPLILVTSLFFLWGMAYGLLDVLNKHFQETLNITTARSTLLQAAYFGAYFLIALPAGLFMNKFGYKKGIILGLLLYAFGAFLFYPAAQQSSFNFFLLAVFILASGLTCLETAANPYVTVLGKPETSEFRLNLSQCFNGVGSFIGPIIGANLFFGTTNTGSLESVQLVYLLIAGVVLLIAALFFRTPLPEIKESEVVSSELQDKKPLFAHSNFTNAIIAQFFYVAAQVGIAALFINYCTKVGSGIDNTKASYLLSVAMILFTAGRFAGTGLMKVIAPNKLLTVYALINILLCGAVVWANDWLSVYSLMAIFFFESIMFPTIFALGIKDLGHHTKKGSSFIIMSIVGGALVPYVMGLLTDKYSIATAYVVPLACFIVVAWYGWNGYKIKLNNKTTEV
ncbi:sugar MFS transporter [Solitalea lacus]|uniref:sugar MFS transporter n=1 Tax=Solitalea lacus TaxID=2911172 RepID=UPI001EDB17BF|nr:sugar MFS transporter [Solitalea lacus]UKJ05867.1 sugar MFS transporter [Solitalea lacus]